MKYTATINGYTATGSSQRKAQHNLAEVIRAKSESWDMIDGHGEPIREPKKLDAARKRLANKLIKQIRLSITVADLSGWEEDGYHSGFGQRRLAVTEFGRWQIESYTDAEGNETITACPQKEINAAAQRSFAALGGVRGLTTGHVPQAAKITLTGKENLLEVLS